MRTGDSDALINGLLRATGRASLDEGTGKVEFAPSLAVGDTWMLTALWRELGFEDSFRRVLRNRRQFDAERLLRVMVFNRLCDPESKLGISRWPDLSSEDLFAYDTDEKLPPPLPRLR